MGWTHVPDADGLSDGEMAGVTIGGEEVAVYRHDGRWFATANVCTHQFALLTDGWLEDGSIECPLHQARFDICTGKAQCAPATDDLRVFPVRIEDGRVFVEV